MSLLDEKRDLQRLLKGSVVKRVWRYRSEDFGIEFEDGMRLFVDWLPKQVLELSVTESASDD